MATVDPNPPVQKDSRADDVWTDEADSTPGSPDTTLVTGNLGKGNLSVDTTAVNTGKQPTTHSEIDGANVETDGVYVSGYPLGAEEDDSTNPLHIAPNTNIAQKVDNYTGTTNGASAADTIVPGDTTQAGGHSFDSTTTVLANQPGAKQPDLTSGSDVMFGAQQGSVPSQELDTLSFTGGAGTLPSNYGTVPASSGTSSPQFGQANNTPGELDTTNTAMPTAVAFNDGTTVGLPTSYAVSNKDTLYGYPGLTAGVGDTAPSAPYNVSWVFGPGRAIVSWSAPGSQTISAPVQAAAVGSPTGGTLAAGTYYYKITATDAYGETTGSNERSAAFAGLVPPVQAAAVVTNTDGGSFAGAETTAYKVTATNAIGESLPSNEQTAAVTATDDSVTVSWAVVTGATGYKVYRGTAGAGSEDHLIATIGSGATVTFKDVGAAGTVATVPVTDTTASTNSVALSWAAVTNATGYKVYRGTAPGAENNLIATLGAVLLVTDTGTAGTTASPPATNTATTTTTGGAPVREYLVYGYQVRGVGNLPADDTAADAMKGQHTVSAHAHALVRSLVDGSTQSEELVTQVEIDHLTPGDYYFFRVQARNDVASSALSTVVGISYPTAPATPYYRLSEVDITGTEVLVPGWTEPEGSTLTDLTFTNSPGIDELGNNLTGQDATQLAAQGEEGEDRL